MNNEQPGWLLAICPIPEALEDEAGAILAEIGSGGIEFRPQKDGVTLAVAYFPLDSDREKLSASIHEALDFLAGQEGLNITFEEQPGHDWVSHSRDSFKPIPAGDHFLFHPSWEIPEDTHGRILIQLDPQQAFGTGSHETTRLCIALLESHFLPDTRSVLDVGCGSGILMLGAARWAERLGIATQDLTLVGIENDVPSVEVAQENLENAHLPFKWSILLDPLESFRPPLPFHFLFANILSGVLAANMERLLDVLAPGGTAILSGILAAEDIEFSATLAQHPWEILEKRIEGEWIAYALRKIG